MTRGRWAARARHVLWRALSPLVGGVRIGGRVPEAPMVLVANHTSHADTAALLAALPPDRLPVLAAAQDYWFSVPWRRAVVTALVGALPVSRTGPGAYEALLEAAAPVIAAGGTVVIYPEGTRGQPDTPVATFRSGAQRLAADLGVPLVPVGISGTGRVLPKHGRLRPEGVRLRFGEPLPPERCRAVDPEVVRAEVQALRDDGSAVPWPDSRLFTWLDRRSDRELVAAGFLWGVAEAVSWPIIAEMFLVLVGAPQHRRLGRVATSVAAGSVVGVLAHALAARAGWRFPAPLTTPRMHAAARDQLAASPYGVREQAFNGIPVKVYARAAGEGGTDLVRFGLATAVVRPARILGVGVLIGLGARWAAPLMRRRTTEHVVLASVVLAEGLHRVIRRWR
ncbi:MAG: 1-acyl-sn-glycerol-3-phosphate acyltransferase [Actinomycetales bacterium]|nr:1-acyl-sn-glycerol-3-phosphate acyltransferase [Actinomycetales bacterium]